MKFAPDLHFMSRSMRWLILLLGPILLASFLVGADKKTPARKDAAKSMQQAETNLVENLTATALESVVIITQFGRNSREEVGAGFIISEDGLVATALHVIGEGRPVAVELPGGRRCEVTEVYASDRNFDLAILRVDATKLRPLKLGDPGTLKQGATVIALGNPVGLHRSMVQGVVSAKRDLDGIEMIQLAIPIEPGNSGGPLLDMKGRVQGVVTLKSALTPNLGFAVPASLVQLLLDRPNPVPMTRWLHLRGVNPKEWTPRLGAHWRQRAGRIEVEDTGTGFGGRSLLLSQQLVPDRPYEIAVEVRLSDEGGAAGLIFEADGGDKHYGFYPSAGQLRLTRFDGPSVYSWTILKQVPFSHYKPGDWNHLRVRTEPKKLLCYVNGHLAIESQDDGLIGGQVGLAKFRDTKAQFKNFQVGTNLAATSRPDSLPSELAKQVRELDDLPGQELLDAFMLHATPVQQGLNQRARELETQAGQLRKTALAIHRKGVQAELEKALQGPEERIDLFYAALLIAKFDNPDLDPVPYHHQLEEMARELSARLPHDADAEARLGALTAYLFTENGFHGSRSDYHNRANSYINDVLDDREGLPITLSVLFIELAQRIGLKGVSGLPLPGHFMVGFQSGQAQETPQIIDVFNGGKRLSRSQAQERVIDATGEGFRDEALRPASKRDIIVRMLRNLIGISDRSNQALDTARYLDLVVALLPDSAPDRLVRARARLQTGNVSGAKADLKWLLDQRPAGADLDGIAELYRSL
jgi:regulator of sirC expression with transglutaminase-like and TPR domain